MRLSGFTFESVGENAYSVTVKNATAVLDVAESVQSKKGAIVEIVDSADGKVSLTEGENTVTIRVHDGGENEALYTLTVYRNHLYTVYGDGEAIGSIEEGETLAVPAAPVAAEGKAFVAWYADEAKTTPFAAVTATSDVYIYAGWRNLAVYTVTVSYVDAAGNTLFENKTEQCYEGETVAILSPVSDGGLIADRAAISVKPTQDESYTVTYKAPALYTEGVSDTLKGTGKKNDPYLIENGADLLAFAKMAEDETAFADKYVSLTEPSRKTSI